MILIVCMFISLEHRYAFVHIPKTAGEWLFHMLKDCVWKDRTLSIAFWGQDHKHAIDLTHLHQGNIANYISPELYNECVSFCVVRNPYNRFYSAFGDLPSKMDYSESVSNRQPNAQRFWTHKYQRYEDAKSTKSLVKAKQLFQTFCDIVENHNVVNDSITKHNIHLVPQYKFVYSEDSNKQLHKNVDYVLRFETLGKDLTTLFNKHHFPHAKRPRKHYTGSYKIQFDTADETRNQKSYLDKYTPASIALVNRVYTKDFELFGFEKLDPAQFESIDKLVVSMANTPFNLNGQQKNIRVKSHSKKNRGKKKRKKNTRKKIVSK